MDFVVSRVRRYVTVSAGFLAGLVSALAVGLAAWDHNPEGAFHDGRTGAVHWGAFGPLLAMSFALPFLSALVLSGVVHFFSMLARKFAQ
jgi:hypothetical protein